jgi:two-component system CheB/CheR fusion protein
MRILPYRTLENMIDGVVITFVNIDKIKEGEELRRLAKVARDSNDAITVQEFDGSITAWNLGAERMYGYSESEALKMNISELVPEEKKKEALNLVRQISSGDTIDSLKTQRLTKDGRILEVWLTVTELVDEEGNIVSVATTERDITEWKQSKKKV